MDSNVEVVKGWLAGVFPGYEIAHSDQTRRAFDRNMTVFRVTDIGSPIHLLWVTDRLLDDAEPTSLKRLLSSSDLGALMKRDHTMQVTLRADGIVPTHEELSITVKGEQYRVVRDSDHNVFLHRPSGERVQRPGQFVMDSSIFNKSDEQWRQEIETLV